MNLVFPHLIDPMQVRPSAGLLPWDSFLGWLRPPAPLIAFVRAPSFLPATLFEMHLVWWILAAGAGVILMLYARSRGDVRMLRAGQVVTAVTAVWCLSAMLLDTPAERLHNAHLALANAARNGTTPAGPDVDTIVSYLAPGFQADAPDVHIDSAKGSAKEQIADTLKAVKIQEATITAYRSTLEPPTAATTQLTVYTRSDTAGIGPMLTTWKLTWEDMPQGDWQITRATLTVLANSPRRPIH